MAGAAPFRRKMRRRRTKNCGKQGIGGEATNKRMHKMVPMCPACGERKDGGIAQNLSGIAYHRGNITAPPSHSHNTQDFAKPTFYEVLLFFLKKRRRTVFTIRRLFMDLNRYPAVKPIERNVLTPQTLR